MKSKCDLCGRQFDARNIWKNQNKQFCSGCTTLKILELAYRGISSEVEEQLIIFSRDMEKLIDRKQEAEVLPLAKKALSMVDNMVVPERIWSLISHGVHFFNEGMKREGLLETKRFIKVRNWMSTKLTYIAIIFYQKKKPLESWKFFIGNVPGYGSD